MTAAAIVSAICATARRSVFESSGNRCGVAPHEVPAPSVKACTKTGAGPNGARARRLVRRACADGCRDAGTGCDRTLDELRQPGLVGHLAALQLIEQIVSGLAIRDGLHTGCPTGRSLPRGT